MRKSVINSDKFTGTKILQIKNLVYLVIHNYGASPVDVIFNDYLYQIPAADTSKGVSVPQNSFELDCKGFPFDLDKCTVKAGTNTVIVNSASLMPDGSC